MGLIIEILFGLVILLIIIFNLGIIKMNKELKEIPNKFKLSGFEVAKIVSSKLSEEEPHIIKKNGKFLDHYNQSRNVIKLSPEVFDGEDAYASIIAINTALETKKGSDLPRNHNINSFIVVASYLMIIIGAFLNNANIIHFGFILFIIAFVLELIFSSTYKNEEDIEEIKKLVKELKVLDLNEDNEEYLILLPLIRIARLPYSFIIKFR